MEDREAARIRAEGFVKAYCHIGEIPEALDWVVARLSGAFLSGDDVAGVQEITEGDTSVRFYDNGGDGLPGDVRAAMQRCRRVRWRT